LVFSCKEYLHDIICTGIVTEEERHHSKTV
jgi:hypothetical protein